MYTACIHTTWISLISCLSLNTFFPENMPSPSVMAFEAQKSELQTSLEMQLPQNGSAWQQPRIQSAKAQCSDRRSQRSVPNLGVLVSNPQGLGAAVKCSSEHLHANLGWQKGSTRIQVGISQVEDCCHMCNIS